MPPVPPAPDDEFEQVDVSLLQRFIVGMQRIAAVVTENTAAVTLNTGRVSALDDRVRDLEKRTGPACDAYEAHIKALDAADTRETLAYRNAKAGALEILSNKVVIGAVVTALGAGIGLGGGSSRIAAVFRALTTPAVVSDPAAPAADPLVHTAQPAADPTLDPGKPQ
jgi:hypothetical protein